MFACGQVEGPQGGPDRGAGTQVLWCRLDPHLPRLQGFYWVQPLRIISAHALLGLPPAVAPLDPGRYPPLAAGSCLAALVVAGVRISELVIAHHPSCHWHAAIARRSPSAVQCSALWGGGENLRLTTECCHTLLGRGCLHRRCRLHHTERSCAPQGTHSRLCVCNAVTS